MGEMFQYVGYLKRQSGYNVVLLEEVKDGDGMRPVLVKGKYGNDLPFLFPDQFDKTFKKIPIGYYVNVLFNRYGNIASVEETDVKY